MTTSEKLFNVVARGSYTKARVILATYDSRKMAEQMLSNYYVHHWPSFALSVEEVPVDRHSEAT